MTNPEQWQFSHYCPYVPATILSSHTVSYMLETQVSENMYSLSYFAAMWEDLTYVFLCISRPTEQCHEVGDNCSILERSQKRKIIKTISALLVNSLLVKEVLIPYSIHFLIPHSSFPNINCSRMEHWSSQFHQVKTQDY